jgi:hypothetical protein
LTQTVPVPLPLARGIQIGAHSECLEDVQMIECGDLVREVGTNDVLKVVGYTSATNQFQVQLGNSIIPIRWLPESSLELVEKARTYDSTLGPRLIPERGILD